MLPEPCIYSDKPHTTMSTWYSAKVKFMMLVEGRHKTVTELYLLNCISHGDVEATCAEILASRIKHPNVDVIAKQHLSDVYKMNDGPLSEVEGDFYLVKVACDFGESKTVDKHLVNADSPAQAEARVKDRLKGVLFDYEITHADKTQFLGVYDKDNIVWVEDFRKRQEDLEAQGRKEANYDQQEINFDKKPDSDQPQSDPNAITAMVIRSGVETVDAEDLENGFEPEANEDLRPIAELQAGDPNLLEAPEETETDEPVEEEVDD